MNAPWNPRRGEAASLSERLFADGYCIVRGLVPSETVRDLSDDLDERFARIDRCDGPFFGRSTKRIQGLLKRSRHAEALVMNEAVLRLVDEALLPHCDRVQLNLTQAIEIEPGEKAQVPHRDQDMWQRAVPGIEYLVNVMWPLTDFTEENGATRVWPGTHRDISVRRPPIGEAVFAEMAPGDALIFLGSTVHGAGANRSAMARRGVVVGYAAGWLKPLENMFLTYPPEVAAGFPPALADLIGYRCHAGNLGNYDGQCPSLLLRAEHDEFRGAREVMAPEHRAILERFALIQDWA